MAKNLSMAEVIETYCQETDRRQAVYHSLCNREWFSDDGRFGVTWRAAGCLVARTDEDYMDYYCTGHEGEVDQDFADFAAKHGWIAEAF